MTLAIITINKRRRPPHSTIWKTIKPFKSQNSGHQWEKTDSRLSMKPAGKLRYDDSVTKVTTKQIYLGKLIIQKKTIMYRTNPKRLQMGPRLSQRLQVLPKPRSPQESKPESLQLSPSWFHCTCYIYPMLHTPSKWIACALDIYNIAYSHC